MDAAEDEPVGEAALGVGSMDEGRAAAFGVFVGGHAARDEAGVVDAQCADHEGPQSSIARQETCAKETPGSRILRTRMTLCGGLGRRGRRMVRERGRG